MPTNGRIYQESRNLPKTTGILSGLVFKIVNQLGIKRKTGFLYIKANLHVEAPALVWSLPPLTFPSSSPALATPHGQFILTEKASKHKASTPLPPQLTVFKEQGTLAPAHPSQPLRSSKEPISFPSQGLYRCRLSAASPNCSALRLA